MNIWLLLGIKPEGFRSGLKRAGDDVKDFKKLWKGLGDIFAAGGLTAIVIGFFQNTIAAARELKGELSENAQAVIRFGSAWEQNKQEAAGWGVEILGWINRAGEAMGGLLNFVAGFETARNDFVTSQAAEGAEKAEQSLAKAKQHAEEFKAVTVTIKSETEKINDLRDKQLTTQELVNKRHNEENKLAMQLINYEGDKLGYRQLEAKLIESRRKSLEAENTLDKENADTAKKAADEDLKWLKERDRLTSEKQKLQYEALATEQQLAVMKQSELKLEQSLRALRAAGEDTLQSEVDLLGVQAEKRKLIAELAETTAKADEAARKEAEAQVELTQKNLKIRSDFMSALVLGGKSSEDISQADEGAIRELLRRNNQQLELLRQNPGSAFDYGNSLSISRIVNENTRLQRELAARDDFRQNYNFLGDDAARRNFKGDPFAFDQLVQRWISGEDKQDETNRLLGDVRDELQGKNGVGVRRSLDTLSDRIDRGFTLIGQIGKG